METVAEGLLDEILGGKLSREDAKTRREGTRRGDRWGENLMRRREDAKGGGSSMNVEEGSSVVVDTAFHLHRDIEPGLLESVYEAVLARMLEERGVRVERQVSVAFDFNGMHFDEGLRVFASSRESESRGHAKTSFSVRWKTFCWNCRTVSPSLHQPGLGRLGTGTRAGLA
jgi:hypothetical protein